MDFERRTFLPARRPLNDANRRTLQQRVPIGSRFPQAALDIVNPGRLSLDSAIAAAVTGRYVPAAVPSVYTAAAAKGTWPPSTDAFVGKPPAW